MSFFSQKAITKTNAVLLLIVLVLAGSIGLYYATSFSHAKTPGSATTSTTTNSISKSTSSSTGAYTTNITVKCLAIPMPPSNAINISAGSTTIALNVGQEFCLGLSFTQDQDKLVPVFSVLIPYQIKFPIGNITFKITNQTDYRNYTFVGHIVEPFDGPLFMAPTTPGTYNVDLSFGNTLIVRTIVDVYPASSSSTANSV